MPAKENDPGLQSHTPGQLEKEEAWLWRLALSFLIFLAVALCRQKRESGGNDFRG